MTEDRVERMDEAIGQWVTFTLDAESYGIDVMRVQEVLSVPEITAVPGAPPWIIGVINLRGNVVPVIDTRMRLGMSSKPPGVSDRVIVIEADEQIVGILVDSVAEVAHIRAGQINSTPNIGRRECVRYIHGVVSWNGALLILLDSVRLFAQQRCDHLATL